MKDLTIFSYQDTEVRTVVVDGEPWFVAADVCEYFGVTNRNRVMQAVDPEDKGGTQIDTPGGRQTVTTVNESGLYTLLFSLQPTKARGLTDEQVDDRVAQVRRFKRWVTREVLPSIRKHGGYLTADKVEEVLADPDTIIRLATDLKNERERRAALEAQAEADKPKVLFADAVSTSKTTILVGELAKILRANGVEVGQNRLFEYLREKGFLIRRKGSDWNMPTQRSMEMGLFEIKETAITHSDGHISISKTTKVTGRGQQYFIDMFLGVAA